MVRRALSSPPPASHAPQQQPLRMANGVVYGRSIPQQDLPHCWCMLCAVSCVCVFVCVYATARHIKVEKRTTASCFAITKGSNGSMTLSIGCRFCLMMIYIYSKQPSFANAQTTSAYRRHTHTQHTLHSMSSVIGNIRGPTAVKISRNTRSHMFISGIGATLCIEEKLSQPTDTYKCHSAGMPNNIVKCVALFFILSALGVCF